MRTIKPIFSSVLSRCIEHQRQYYLGVSVLTHIPLVGEVRLGSEQSLWPMLAKYAPGFTEESIPRNRSEYLLYGNVYPAKNGSQLAYMDFGIRVAGLVKKGRAFGRRLVEEGSFRTRDPVEPVAIIPENAYGGFDYLENPLGMGHPSSAQNGLVELPKIELLSQPWNPEASANHPAIFGQLDIMHPHRQKLTGTYGDDWLKTDYPGMPKDADWAVFNTAMPDQQLQASFKGDESFDLINLSSNFPHISNRLPGVGARVLVKFKKEENQLRDLSTTLRSLVFLPEAGSLIMIWQAQCKTATDDASDIELLMTGFEHLSRPRSVNHYQKTLMKWMDKDDGNLSSLDESPLAPEGMAYDGLLDGLPDLNQPADPDSLGARLRRRTDGKMKEARAEVAEHGLDPDEHAPPEHLPPPLVFPPLPELGPFLRKIKVDAEQTDKEAKAFREEKEREAEKVFETLGMDFSVVQDEMAGKGAGAKLGPPKSCKQDSLQTLRTADEQTRALGGPVEEIQQMLVDKTLHQQWDEVDRMVMQGYRMGAHHQIPYPRSKGAQAMQQRSLVEERLQQGQDLEGLDLTGADLSGINLNGVNCRDVLLEAADLSGADLSGACFTNAVLAHADLRGANLQDCDFGKANLGKAQLQGANARKANFIKANLEQTTFTKTILRNAVFQNSQWYELDLSECDLRGAEFQKASFLKCNLSHSLLQGVRMDGVQFINCQFENSFWQECNGEGVTFVNIKNPQMDFSNANLPRSMWVGEVDLSAAVFAGANLDQAYFSQESQLQSANFSGAHAIQCDFTACQLRQADLRTAILKNASLRNARLEEADLSGADLMEASLQNARLQGANLMGTHLYAADLARIYTDKYTNAADAVYTKARIYPRVLPPNASS